MIGHNRSTSQGWYGKRKWEQRKSNRLSRRTFRKQKKHDFVFCSFIISSVICSKRFIPMVLSIHAFGMNGLNTPADNNLKTVNPVKAQPVTKTDLLRKVVS